MSRLRPNHSYDLAGIRYRCLRVTPGGAVVREVKDGCTKKLKPGSREIVISVHSEGVQVD